MRPGIARQRTRPVRDRARLFTALFFSLLFLAGLLASGDYGMPFDELSERVILRENLKEYAVRLLGEDSPASRYYDSLGVNRISQSIEQDHGQSAYYLFAPLLALPGLAPDTLGALWQAYTWLWFMAGVLAVYGFGRELGFCRLSACGGALLLYLCPRFFAEGHYNNKDMALLSLTLLTLLAGLRLLKKPCLSRGLWFSLVGAMAANTKIAGLLPWGLMGLATALLLTAQRRWSLSMLGVALSTALGLAFFYALLTPALWPAPAAYFRHALANASGFTRWTGVLIYRGMRIDQQIAPIPRLYLPTLMAATLPLYLLPLAALGQARAAYTGLRALARGKGLPPDAWKPFALAALTLTWLLPLGYAAYARPVVYNGWRHFYFTFAGIALLAGYGLHGLFALAGRLRPRLRHIASPLLAALLCLCFAGSAVGIASNHPYQYGYYNPLFRGSAATDMELDYWAVSSLNAMRALLRERDRAGEPLLLGSRDEMSLLSLRYGWEGLSPDARTRLSVTDSPDAPYLLYNTTYALLYGVAPPAGYRELFRAESYGNTLCILYEKD